MITVGAMLRLFLAHPPLDVPAGAVGLLTDNIEIVFEEAGEWWTMVVDLAHDENGTPVMVLSKDGHRVPAALRQVDLGATPDTEVHAVSGASTRADA